MMNTGCMVQLLKGPLLSTVRRYSYPSTILSQSPDFSSSVVLSYARSDVRHLISEVRKSMGPRLPSFCELVRYQFDSRGKLLRPLLVTLMSACTNMHSSGSIEISFNNDPLKDQYPNRKLSSIVSPSQHRIAMITEMIHTASLIHDDLLDSADLRRGKQATYRTFGHREAIYGGDFILTHSSRLLAEIGDPDVIAVLSLVIQDLIHGELMQLSTSADDTERFQAYLTKTYRKTASLMGNSCKAVAMLSRPTLPKKLIQSAYEFGRHLGMAFQLIDDVLDFVSDKESLGKPAGGADMQIGIATGPVLFAAQSFPELDAILLRQFSLTGDKERALELIEKSDGIGQTRMLAEFHFQAAQRCLGDFRASEARQALLHIAATCLQRNR
ncbi:unnamed protein product [Calicophoron daubneyi]|uniref:Decaprenyl-diphosphate synthase subunit 1 n=1 Tax=Calicophoron daubneyi TaxID=300641 RepID=A0AAV2TBF2_CALDB